MFSDEDRQQLRAAFRAFDRKATPGEWFHGGALLAEALWHGEKEYRKKPESHSGYDFAVYFEKWPTAVIHRVNDILFESLHANKFNDQIDTGYHTLKLDWNNCVKHANELLPQGQKIVLSQSVSGWALQKDSLYLEKPTFHF